LDSSKSSFLKEGDSQMKFVQKLLRISLILGVVMFGSFSVIGADTNKVNYIVASSLEDNVLTVTDNIGQTTLLDFIPSWVLQLNGEVLLKSSSDEFVLFDVPSEHPAIDARFDVWPASTTTAYVVHYEYGTKTQFRVDVSPDMSPGSWRKLIPGELLGVTYSSPTNAAKYVDYWLDPKAFGTATREVRIFSNFPEDPPPN